MKMMVWALACALQIAFLKVDFLKPFLHLSEKLHLSLVSSLEESKLAWFHGAILFGEDSGLRQRSEINSFVILGLYHLIVVSGSHLTFFVKLLTKTVFFLPERFQKFLALIFLVLFTMANQLQAACLRALVQWSLREFLPGKIRSEPNYQFLSTALCLILQPQLFESLSFQLSCAASMALGIISSLELKSQKLKTCLTPLLCVLLTAPLLLGIQPCLSWLIIPVNILALPLVEASLIPLSILSFIFPFLKGITEPILLFLFKILDFISRFHEPTFCFNQEGSRRWGLYYILFLLVFWRLLLPLFLRAAFWRSQKTLPSMNFFDSGA